MPVMIRRRIPQVRLSLVLAAAAALASPRAAAAAAVEVLRPSLDDSFVEEIFHRVVGELRVHAFAVQEREAVGEDVSLADARALLANGGSAACVSFNWQGDTTVVRLWIAVPGETPMLLEAVSLRRTPEVPTVLAARAVDLLTMALDRGRRASAATVAAPPSVPTLTSVPTTARPPIPPVWSIALGATLLLGGTRFGEAIGPRLSVARAITRRFAVGLRMSAPLVGQRVANDDASAKQAQGLGVLEGLALIATSRRLVLRLCLGAGVDYLHVSGDVDSAVASAMPSQATALVPAATLGAMLSLAITPRLAVDLTAEIVAAYPRPSIHVGHETVSLTDPQPALSLNVRFGL